MRMHIARKAQGAQFFQFGQHINQIGIKAGVEQSQWKILKGRLHYLESPSAVKLNIFKNIVINQKYFLGFKRA